MSEIPSIRLVDFSKSRGDRSESKPDSANLLSGDPVHSVENLFSDTTGQMFAGTWRSTNGRWRVRYTENEFCYITQGRVRITDERGTASTFTVGDAFVIPAGFSGVWEVLEPVAKLYVIFEALGPKRQE